MAFALKVQRKSLVITFCCVVISCLFSLKKAWAEDSQIEATASLSKLEICAALAQESLEYDLVETLYSALAAEQESLFHKPLAHCLGSVPAVMLAEAAQTDLDKEDQRGITPLQNALAEENYPLAEALLQAGANPNKTSVFNRHALFYAQSAQAVRLLGKHQIELDKLDSYGSTALIAATPSSRGACGHTNRAIQTSALEALCRAGANPNIGVDHCGDNLWTRAARSGAKLMHAVVQHCPLPNAEQLDLLDTFKRAMAHDKKNGLHVLAQALQITADFDTRSYNEQYFIQEIALGCLSQVPSPNSFTPPVSERILNCGDKAPLPSKAELFEPDLYGVTPLQYLIRAAAEESLAKVLGQLSPADIPTGFSLSALDLQAIAGSPRYDRKFKIPEGLASTAALSEALTLARSGYAAKWMLEQGADPNHVGLDKRTPLTTVTGDQYITEKLLDAGADPNLALCDCWPAGSEMNGLTPLLATIQQSGDNPTMARLLIAGANPNQANRNGTTPAAAVASQFYTKLKTLFEYGADFNLGQVNGRKPLSIAIRQYTDRYASEQEEILGKMLQQQPLAKDGKPQTIRVNANIVEKNGRSLLNNLIQEKFSVKRIAVLLENGAMVDSDTRHFARLHPNAESLLALIESSK